MRNAVPQPSCNAVTRHALCNTVTQHGVEVLFDTDRCFRNGQNGQNRRLRRAVSNDPAASEAGSPPLAGLSNPRSWRSRHTFRSPAYN
eukprot:6135413-Prymnesium_polylepis.1